MSVGPTRGPVQRPSDDRDFTEIFQRLDDLERVSPLARYTIKASIVQSGVPPLGGAVQQGLVTPDLPLDLYGMNLACPVYLRVADEVFVFLEQYSGSDKDASVGLSALMIGLPVSASPGMINTTLGAQVRTAPVFTTVPTGAGGAYAVFTTSEFDTDSMVNIGTHPTSLKASTAGVYLATASVTFVS